MNNISLSKYIIGFEENTLSSPTSAIAVHDMLSREIKAAAVSEIVRELHDYIERNVDIVDGGQV